MRPQQRGERPGLAGRRRRYGSSRHAGRARCGPTFNTTTGLPQRGGAVERGGKAIRLADRLDKAADHRGVRVLDQVFEIIGARSSTASLPEETTWLKPKRLISRQQADADPAALRDDADIAGEPGRVAQLLQIGRARGGAG